jgi:hypothetical protein
MNINAENVGIRLPNGKVKMMKSKNPSDKNREFNSDSDFYKAYPNVNEGSGALTSVILDMINE